MDGYGEAGRRIYIWSSLILDTLFPLAYVTFMAGAAYRWSGRRRWSLILPIGAGAVDLCENAQVIAMLVRYPNISASQVGAASLFTQGKSYVFQSSLALVVILAIFVDITTSQAILGLADMRASMLWVATVCR